MIVKCCKCGSVKSGESWSAAASLGPSEEMVSHGYCPPCASQAMHEFEGEAEELNHTGTLRSAWSIEQQSTESIGQPR